MAMAMAKGGGVANKAAVMEKKPAPAKKEDEKKPAEKKAGSGTASKPLS